MGVVIDQRKNYSAEFGSIYRSSAIFYKPANVDCTISVSNYWQFKNGIEVGLLFTTRTLAGKVVAREERRFDEANVINLRVDAVEQGSIEVEAFANQNLRIPYAAAMAVYETEMSASLVHSYGRNHSLIELEDGNCITEGREGCWTVRCGASIRNMAVFHNGHLAIDRQTATLFLTNAAGAEKVLPFSLDPVAPFATVEFDLDELSPGYRDFLAGEDGWATVHFQNESAFTRLLITWYDAESNCFQVTHSNFDYSAHTSNLVKSTKPAYMKLPDLGAIESLDVVVYPKMSAGDYSVGVAGSNVDLDGGRVIDLAGTRLAALHFERKDGDLPARIVTAVKGAKSSDALPFECSLGVATEQRPPKRFHWAMVSNRLSSRLLVTDYRELFGEPVAEILFVMRMYNAKDTNIHERKMVFKDLDSIPSAIDLRESFGADFEHSDGDYSYVSVFCDYGGLVLFSTIEKGESLALEHSF